MAHLPIVLLMSAWPVAQAHMQMIDPSPFRDPQAHRSGEAPDYNILMPLAADGSNFACKGYHLNTPWTTVRTYNVGDTYTMRLKGSATHGGGSCQLSLSFDGGSEFRVIKSIEGGCPEAMKYDFKIPEDLNRGLSRKTQGLFAWTWFNRIGNREMYMNCAVVDIVPKSSNKRSVNLESRDTSRANAAAQKALASYPSLFVANLKKINDCVTKETVDVIFDDPGNAVSFANGDSKSSKASFKRGECTGRGSASAGSSSSNSSPPSPPSGGSSSSDSNSSGNDGQWHGADSKKDDGDKKDDNSSGQKCDLSDGMWHPDCDHSVSHNRLQGASNMAAQKQVQQAVDLRNTEDVVTGKEPTGDVANQLDAYLASLYGSQANKEKRDVLLDARAMAESTIKPTPFTWPTAQPNRQPSTIPNRRPLPSHRPRPSRRPPTSRRPRPSRFPRPSIRPLGIPLLQPLPLVTPRPIPLPEPSSKSRKPTDPMDDRRPWRHGDKTTPEALQKELDDVRGNDGPHLDSAINTRGVQADLDAERCQSPNRWYRRGSYTWLCGRKDRSVQRETSSEHHMELQERDSKAVVAGPRSKPRPRPRPKPQSTRPKNFRNNAMRWVEDQLAHLEWTIGKLTWLYNRKPPSARPAKRPSKRQDDPSGDTTFSLFLQYLDRLQDKVIECIRLVSNGAGQSSPLDRVANSSMVDGRQKPVTKEKRQLVVPAMIGPLLQKFEMVFDSVSVPSDDAKYEKRSQDEQNLEKRQMVTPGINGAALPPGLVDVIQKIGDAAQPLPAQVKNPDGSTHPFPVEAGKDHSHAWDNPPGKLGPKPSNLPAVAAELKAYLDNLEAETQKPTPIQRADTTPPLRPKDPRPPKQIKSTPLPTPKEDTWTDGVFPAQVPTPSTTTKPPVDPNADDVAAVLPYFLGPGPVIPSGVSVNWPGPVHGEPKPQQVDNLENMPQVVNDLTPEDEESVKKWFADEAERQKEELVNSDGKDGTGE